MAHVEKAYRFCAKSLERQSIKYRLVGNVLAATHTRWVAAFSFSLGVK